jgi:ring-1,2-phenylacetyl-CoA epoxidase subunit PaaD
MDPEVPVLSVCDLGIVRAVEAVDDELRVVVTPTYSGCPATEVIEAAIREALLAAGAARVRVETRLAPAWTTDWIGPEAREKLREHGIAPPGRCAPTAQAVIHFHPACPRCRSLRTERLSEFGATACKALHRCLDCREPFEAMKAI